MTRGFHVAQGVADFLLDVVAGIFITHLYRAVVLKTGWYKLSLKALVPRIIPSIILLSTLYSFVIAGKLYGVRLFFYPVMLGTFGEYLEASGVTLFITGTRLMSIWVLAYHLYHYAQREIRIARENAELSVVAREAQLGRLAAQLNPHFFFNALNTIKFLTATNQAAARRSIDLLSGLLRYTLYTQQDGLTPLREEVALATDYLELEQLRFEDRLLYTVSVSDEIADQPIPPFCVQTLVENAIKHGISQRRDGGNVHITAGTDTGNLVITVRNSGTFDPQTTNAGLGLANLKERLRLHYGAKAELHVMQVEPETVLATLILPVV